MQHVEVLSRYPVVLITYNEIPQNIIASQSNDHFINSMKEAVEHTP